MNRATLNRLITLTVTVHGQEWRNQRENGAFRPTESNLSNISARTRHKSPVFSGLSTRERLPLTIHFDGLIRKGAVRDYADLARLGLVTRARVTQIMNLLNLASDIQEGILFLPRTSSGRDPISDRQVRHIAATPGWRTQRRMCRETRDRARL